MDYFIGALQQFADFKGRTRRKEYWMYILIYFVLSLVAVILDSVIGIQILSSILSLILLVPSISIATRRLHDTSRSGWWQLIILIPVIGFIVLIVFLAQDSHDDNFYGVNTKA